MNKKTIKQFYEYYNKWVKPFVVDEGDNLLESEGQLYSLINSVKDEFIEVAKKEMMDGLTDETKEDEKETRIWNGAIETVIKAIRDEEDKPPKKRGGCDVC